MSGFLFDAVDQVHNDLNAAIVIVTRRLFAETDNFLAFIREGDAFDFCAAPVDSDEHKSLFSVCVVRCA